MIDPTKIKQIEGATYYVTAEPTPEEILQFPLPVNFKIVDVESGTYKLISYKADGSRLTLEGDMKIGFAADGTLANGLDIPLQNVSKLGFSALDFNYETDEEKGTVLVKTKPAVNTDKLQDVTNRGSFSPAPISIGSLDFNFGYITSSNTRLVGAKVADTYTGNSNLIVGTELPNIVNASNNTAIGVGAMQKIIRTTDNLAIGTDTLKYIDYQTTGDSYGSSYGYNFAIGSGTLKFCTAGRANISIGGLNQPNGKTDGSVFFTGKHNIGIGISTLNNATTASMNTVIGNGSAGYITTGIGNIVIGQSAAIGLKTGINNIFIGNGSGGQTSTGTTPDVSNKLCIEQRPYNISQTAFWDQRVTPYMQDYKAGLISGDFVERWVNFNGFISVTPAKMPIADATYTKNLVAKADGTFGWEDKISVPKPPASGNFVLKSSEGVMSWVAE